jgi:hypothetical protein
MLAEIELHTGRWCLMIGDMIIAVEADPCREPSLAGAFWNKHTLEQAAARINTAHAAREAHE